ncbi:MAG: tRNA 2-thiouridine(34) synthase MnmA [Alphaproteobacteria bacterium]|nr:MAG: tRNA 2-thiouridine(34) synthase MnmA [Alphaproteobacteria bacterium]
MSGGVDSSVTAAALVQRGFDVIGVTLQLYDHGAAMARKGACCAGRDIRDAKAIAEKLGFPHYVLDYEAQFQRDVIDDFVDSYRRGETPIPCVRCNQKVKFRDLMQVAHDLGAAALATGHYVRRKEDPQGPAIYRAHDANRDQSYFLFTTTPQQLAMLRFPLGGMEKPQVRALAAEMGLAVAEKPDSQDICFVPSGRYSDVVTRLRPDAAIPGKIVHLDGRVLGQHEGIIHYTIGQRRGLGTTDNSGEPLYVMQLDATKQEVIVGPLSALGQNRVHLRDVNWLIPPPAPDGEPLRVDIKMRSAQPPAPARITPLPDGGVQVMLDAPLTGIAPGQAGVFYDGDRLLGGGWITATDHQSDLAA